jgi:hypothetical protein
LKKERLYNFIFALMVTFDVLNTFRLGPGYFTALKFRGGLRGGTDLDMTLDI